MERSFLCGFLLLIYFTAHLAFAQAGAVCNDPNALYITKNKNVYAEFHQDSAAFGTAGIQIGGYSKLAQTTSLAVRNRVRQIVAPGSAPNCTLETRGLLWGDQICLGSSSVAHWMHLPFYPQVRGFAVRDAWGATWDGLDRDPTTWESAKGVCESLGARLPTVTEIYRNRFGGKRSTLSDFFLVADSDYLWTLIPESETTYYVAKLQSSGGFYAGTPPTTLNRYRCIWPPTGNLVPGHCYEDPIDGCSTDSSWYVTDKSPRPALTFLGAVSECAVHDASLPTLNLAHTLGLTGIIWVNSQFSQYTGGIFYSRPGVINGALPHGGEYARLDASQNSFYCVSRKPNVPASTAPGASCAGGCGRATVGLNKFLYDSTDRTTGVNGTTLEEALSICSAQDATLANLKAFSSLRALNVPRQDELWSGGIMASLLGGFWQYVTYPTANLAAPSVRSQDDLAFFRCVWPEVVPVPTCTNSRAFSFTWRPTENLIACISNTQANPTTATTGLPVEHDEWGYAWDGTNRAPQNYTDAVATCTNLGGRLPLPSEIYRVRGNGPFNNSLTEFSPDVLFTSRASYGVSLDTGTLYPGIPTQDIPYSFRCTWPPVNEGNLFGGSKCFGPSGAPCFMVNNNLRFDVYERIPMTYREAWQECWLLGGTLPNFSQYLAMIYKHPSIPGSNNWLSDQIAIETTDSRFPLTVSWLDGSNVTPNTWSSSSSAPASYVRNPFRCVFSSEI